MLFYRLLRNLGFCRHRQWIAAVLLSLSGLSINAGLAEHSSTIIVQSTTSTANSGLYDHLLPLFTKDSGVQVHVVAVGTGQAIKNARHCDGDVLLVHAKSAEERFVAEGYGVQRFDLMFNDFIVIGPTADPAALGEAETIDEVMHRLHSAGKIFVSRGDDSGTHKKERALWAAADLSPLAHSGKWYREVGAGMGATLNAAIGMDAYTITDRATWVSFRNKADHTIVFEGDAALLNQYGVIAVNPQHCPTVNAEASETFIDWLLADVGQAAIRDFSVDGHRLFTPNAAKP